MIWSVHMTMARVSFEAQYPDPRLPARLGRLVTPHGTLETPAFTVVGTQATVKGLLPAQVTQLGAQAVLRADELPVTRRAGAPLFLSQLDPGAV